MGRAYAGGTDGILHNNGLANNVTVGAVHFRLKTSQATGNVVPFEIQNASSRFGLSLILAGGKMQLTGIDLSTPYPINFAGAVTVNDGVTHRSIGANWNSANGGANGLFIDGAADGSANSASAWSIGGSIPFAPLALGRAQNAFWDSLIGELSEVAIWYRNLNIDEWIALSKGISPLLLRPVAYEKHVRTAQNMFDTATPTVTGTTVSDHPRAIGP